ncbi:uncharacterized protein LOC122013950 [Zingiber officinale]|uniref:Uncharacterized protein n=1 Tax=Zingiber officinale TaxID=94328 RepID=A0A8J5F5E1_ZINOF|nr:uncharacterized protein LOC122013950 [Zingiber officinale]KAG6483162.1 hypothetical protein ZIOFF_059802 [Zingiber officinale]
MGFLREVKRCCFCSGGGSRIKDGIFASKGPALAAISVGGGSRGGGSVRGTGFLIHRNLLLTTHANLPNAAAAEVAEVSLCHGRLPARLVPQRFFVTSSILDLTIVGIDTMDVDSSSQVQQPHYLKTCCKSSLELGTLVYVLGFMDKEELAIGEGKVVIATDNLIKLSTDGVTWFPGSAGFDIQGNLAFMVCDPMKLASSPTTRSSSLSSWKKDVPMQFGIPIPIVCNWLFQHWEGNLDEVSKPKLLLSRLMSSGHSESSGVTCTLRRIFKANEENDNASSSLQMVQHSKYTPVSSSSIAREISYNDTPLVDLHSTQIADQEILQSHNSVKKVEDAPSKAPKPIFLPLPLRHMLSEEAAHDDCRPSNQLSKNGIDHDVPLVGTWQNDCSSEVQSTASPIDMLEDGFDSGVETMYSAETMESRNIPSPLETKYQNVGRSSSCVDYSRWSCDKQNSAALQKQNTIIPVRKTSSPGAALLPQNHDYCSPTVSSSMKKRNSSEQTPRPRRNTVRVSPRWVL